MEKDISDPLSTAEGRASLEKVKNTSLKRNLWDLVDRALRARPARLLFIVLFLPEILECRRAIKKVSPTTVITPRIVNGHGEWKKRICLGTGKIATALIRHNHTRRGPDADQLIVDATNESADTFQSFSLRQQANHAKPYWTEDYGAQRAVIAKQLMEVPTEHFVIWVTPDTDGSFEVIDGDHRLRIAEIRGDNEMNVMFFIKGFSIDWNKPSGVFLGKFLDRKRQHSL